MIKEIEEVSKQEIEQPVNTVAKLELVYYQTGNWTMNRLIWANPSPDEMKFRIGQRVWPAGESEKTNFTLQEIKSIGEKFYPLGAFVCSTEGGSDRIFYLDAVIKHPKQKIAKELE